MVIDEGWHELVSIWKWNCIILKVTPLQFAISFWARLCIRIQFQTTYQPTNHPSSPPLVQPSLSLKHWAKLNLYEVYCVYRTNYTKLHKLYERLMVSKWKKTNVHEPIEARRLSNFLPKFFFQTPNLHLTSNLLFPNYFPPAKLTWRTGTQTITLSLQ